MYLFPAGQRKTRDVSNPAVKPEGNNVDKNADKSNDKVNDNKNESGNQNKEDQTEGSPVPAVEDNKVMGNEFQVRVVCLSVCMICS